MTLLLAFAFAAGIITVLSPCILPVLPVVLSGSVGGGRWRPFGIISGFLVSFSTLTLALTLLVRSFGVDPDLLRYVAAIIIIILAVILVVPALKDRFMLFTSSLLSRSRKVQPGSPEGNGFFPGVMTGVSLGIVWTPCVGPIMASVITLAITASVDAGAVFITLAYALGTAVPLFAVMQGGRALLNRFPLLVRHLSSIQRVFGVLMLLAGISLLAGWDRTFQTWMLEAFPGYGAGLTAIEENAAVRKALEKRSLSPEGVAIPDRTGSDPLSRTSGRWFNSPPLTLSGLQGKVVMVDFWTYSCINCLRTMPYLKAWHERYAGEGLVIVGVHSPEFAFERDEGNLQEAILSIGVRWPVVQDNDFGIWSAFSNRYWPAHYIFDREGKLVSSRFGEGGYAETETLLRGLLGVENGDSVSGKAVLPDSVQEGGKDITPETYLGTERGADFAGLSGNWKREAEYSEAGEGSVLTLTFTAREVYLVVSTVDGAAVDVEVLVDGERVNAADVVDGRLVADGDRLYQVFTSGEKGQRVLTLKAGGPVRFHAFTFS